MWATVRHEEKFSLLASSFDKMLLEVRIFPPEGIYDLNYSIPANEALERVQARSNEPAIGTANFTSAILRHKLEYAAIAAKNKSGKINRKKYDLYTLMAVASIYANDIDPGNLTTTMLRLTRKDKVNSPAHVNRWVEHVLSFGSEEDRDKVTQQITQSLESANNVSRHSTPQRRRCPLPSVQETHK